MSIYYYYYYYLYIYIYICKVKERLREGEELCCNTQEYLFFAVGTTFGNVHVFTLEGLYIATLECHDTVATCVNFSGEDAIIVGRNTGEIICWTWRTDTKRILHVSGTIFKICWYSV